MDETTQVISILVIVLVFAVNLTATQEARRRRENFQLRAIPAYEAIPSTIGLSIESNRPLHLSMGGAGIGGLSTPLALAAAELFYQITQRAAISDVAPILTVSDASALPLGQDTLRRAYRSQGHLERYRYYSTRWYPSGARSLAFAAAVTSMMVDDKVSANLFAGSFGTELALIMDVGRRWGLPGIAVSDQLEGQAVAYAFSDHVLIGEEVFAAGAYLGGEAGSIAETFTVDVLRWALVLGLLGVMMYGLLNLNRGG